MREPQEMLPQHSGKVAHLCQGIGDRRHLILASNRGPVEFRQTAAGNLVPVRGSGGLVTALGALSRYLSLSWVAAALSEGDQLAARFAGKDGFLSPFPQQHLRLRFVTPPKEAYHRYYNLFSNPALWFLQHSMWDRLGDSYPDSVLNDAWQNGYVLVNRAFADAVADVARRDDRPPLIMLHDYHLYLAPLLIRARLPGAFLHQFVHIPWPEPNHWQTLPSYMRRAICRGLLCNDIVGFQTMRSARDFMRTVQCYLEDVSVDLHSGTISDGPRVTYVRAYPVSVDVSALRQAVATREVEEYRHRLRELAGDQTIIRVDRLDPSKNIVRGFQAFDLLLRQRRDLHGRVRFLAFLVPSRTKIPEYRRYADEVMTAAEQINQSHGRDGWQPVQVFFEDNYPQALAAMTLYDVLLVSPLADGMNLVAKEGPVVNRRDGVVVLSKMAGAHAQLQEAVLSIEPTDVIGMAASLGAALDMPTARRRALAVRLREIVERQDLMYWLHSQFSDINAILQRAPVPVHSYSTAKGRVHFGRPVPLPLS